MTTPLELTISAEPGVTYYIAVDADGGNSQFTVALADLGGGDLPLPAGAVGMLDFMHGVYKWGGSPETTYTADEVVDHPEFIIPGLGAHMSSGGAALGLLAGDFLDHILTGDYTIAIEFSADGSDDVAPFVTEDGSNTFRFYFTYTQDSDFFIFDADGSRSVSDLESDPIAIQLPTYQVAAVTRTDTRVASQFAEGALADTYEDTGGSSTPSTVTQIHFGGYSGGIYSGILIARILLFPSTASAGLGAILVDPVLEAPANDAFSGATALALDTPVNAHNYRCTAETGEPDHGSTASGNSCWFTFQAPSTGNFTVTVTPTGDFGGWGAVIGVYTGSSVGSLSEVASASDYPGAAVTFAATSGVTYRIAVDGAGGNYEAPWAYNPGHSPFTIEVTA